MVRRLLRGVRHLLGAVVLLTGLVCLTEVCLSARRAALLADGQVETLAGLTVPSRTCFRELKPLCETPADAGPVLRTNSYGLRGPEPTVPKPEGVFRVLVLGDEATLAARTPEEQTFCAVAAELLGRTGRRVEVINGGIPGGCPLTLSLLYRHRLVGLRPDAVVVMLDAGDVADDLHCRPYLRQDANERPLACTHPTLGGRRGLGDAWRSEFRLVDIGGQYLLDRWVNHSPPVRDDLLSDRRRTEWLQAPTGAWSGPLQTALTPLSYLGTDVAGAELLLMVVPDRGGPAAGWQEVQRLVGTMGLRLIDPSGPFAQMGEAAGLFAASDVEGDRLSPRGHQRMGFELAALVGQMPGVR